jgi:LmbE family N-acetylglucosaminyl deacetylase
MIALPLARAGERLKVLFLGAHADDIEIGVGATVLGWLDAGVRLHAHWAVLSAVAEREVEARASADAFLCGAEAKAVDVAAFKDGVFPSQSVEIKACLEDLRRRVEPDIVFTHQADDAHQDHREVSKLTTNVFRDQLVLGYEIPKWDGDLTRPNLYIPARAAILERKIDYLMTNFASQRQKDWFDADTFRGLARLRGMECRAAERFAEAFHARKLVLR